MKKYFLYLVCLSSIFHLAGCNRDEVVNPPIFVNASEGAYILSEGVFTPGTSGLSFFNATQDSFYTSIFKPANLGVTPDGLIIFNNNLFITEQGNNGSQGKIYKTDTVGRVLSFKDVGINPYSLTHTNNKLYVTNGPANNVSVVNLNDLTTLKTINVGIFPQEILSFNNKVFVCNTSLFGGASDSTVSVIDAVSDQVINTIQVRKTPSSLAITNDGKILIGCPGSSGTGIIYKVDPENFAKLDSFNTPAGFDKDLTVNKNNNDVFYISFTNNIIRLNLSTKINSIFIDKTSSGGVFFYGYNFDHKNKIHYVTDARNFSTNGNLYIYNETGNLIKTYTTGGYAPRRIVLKLN